MIVIADTSPLIGLLKIGYVEVLQKRFGTVLIPTQVAVELSSPNRPPEIQKFIASPPAWLRICTPITVETIAGLDFGESAAISLAREVGADLLLIDETKGRDAAIARNIRTARLAAVLFDAANVGVLADLQDAFDKLRSTNFRVPSAVLDQLLKQHIQQKLAAKNRPDPGNPRG